MRNCKRHTACTITCPTTTYLNGGTSSCPVSDGGMGGPVLDVGVPISSLLDGGYPILSLMWRYPIPFQTGGIPKSIPHPDLGPDLDGSTPSCYSQGTPLEGTWDQWKYYGMEMGYIPPKGHVTSRSAMGWR